MKGKPAKAPKGRSLTTVHNLPPAPVVTGETIWMDTRTVGQLRELQASLGLASEGDTIAWLCIQLRAIKGA